MSGIIYLLLCVLHGFTCARANLSLNRWEYWATLTCVVGAYYLGRYA